MPKLGLGLVALAILLGMVALVIFTPMGIFNAAMLAAVTGRRAKHEVDAQAR